MPDNNATPEPTLPGTASGAPGTGDQQVAKLEAEVADWRQRFAGLQAKFQKEHDTHEALKASKFDLEQKLTTVTGDLEAAKLNLTKGQELQGKTVTELEGLKTANARMQLIFKEFPGLVEYEAKGLLPTGQGDELKTKLTDFTALLKAQGAAAAQQIVAGAIPPAPTTGGPRTAQDILREANQALREGKRDLYDKLYDEFIKAKA